MNSSHSKNHRKIGKAKKAPTSRVRVRVLGDLDSRFKENLLALRRTTTIPKPSARLARALLLSTAERCLANHLSDRDVILGAMSAAYLIGLSVGMTRDEFVAWLRTSANAFERTTAPASSGN